VDGAAAEEHSLYLGRTTNNVAEYAALLAALERAAALGAEAVEVRSDSQLVVEQMRGAYRVKAPHLLPLWQRARVLAAGFRRCRLVHVPRAANRRADVLANRAMDERVSTLPRPEGV
ncbi:MAG TPA: reverse transcriptase-like protein, partial [Thermoanaerobaculaceae bacterium]|nr:reverse transcriptase-like protein [Thermoanaerobaculaceae bacterium]